MHLDTRAGAQTSPELEPNRGVLRSQPNEDDEESWSGLSELEGSESCVEEDLMTEDDSDDDTSEVLTVSEALAAVASAEVLADRAVSEHAAALEALRCASKHME